MEGVFFRLADLLASVDRLMVLVNCALLLLVSWHLFPLLLVLDKVGHFDEESYYSADGFPPHCNFSPGKVWNGLTANYDYLSINFSVGSDWPTVIRRL